MTHRLSDVVFHHKRLYLVFEYVDQDLKRYMDQCGSKGMDRKLVKVSKHLTCREHTLQHLDSWFVGCGLCARVLLSHMPTSCCEALPTATPTASCTAT